MRLLAQSNTNGKRRLVIGAAMTIVLIGTVAVILHLTNQPSNLKGPAQKWFYDLNTGQLFPGPLNAVPPIPAPSGPLADGTPAGALAHVHTCKTCMTRDLAVAYLEIRTPEAQAKLAALRKVPSHVDPPLEIRFAEEEGILVRRPTDTKWLDHNTTEGRNLEGQTVLELCRDNPHPAPCYPGSR